MSHGKRYSAKERKDILNHLKNHTYQETMDKFNVSQMSLARWVKNQKRREINTSHSLLTLDLQTEIKIYLKLLENSSQVRGVALVTAAGELVLPENQGFRGVFPIINDVTVATSNFLLCAKGFTSLVVNHQKDMEPIFDEISIKTPVGHFFMKEVGEAVLVLLLELEISLSEYISENSALLNQIQTSLQNLLQ